MLSHAAKTKRHSDGITGGLVQQQKVAVTQNGGFAGFRPADVAQREMQELADQGPQAKQLHAVQRMANNRSPAAVIQLAQVTSKDKYNGLLEDVSAKHLYIGTKWRPSNVMNRGIDFSTGNYASILVHLMNNGQNSKWVSTTTNLNVAKGYAGDEGFVYDCHGVTSQGLSANAAYAAHWNNKDEQADLTEVEKTAKSATYPFAHQKETSVWNSVNPESVIAAYTKVAGNWRRYKRGAYLEHADSLPQEVRTRAGS